MLLDKPLDFIRNHPRLVVAQDFELACQRVTVKRVEHLNGIAQFHEAEELWWLQLKVLHRNKPGVSTTTVLSEGSLSRLVDNALVSAEQSHPDPWFRFPIWSQTGTNSSEDLYVPPPDRFLDSIYEHALCGTKPLTEKYEWWTVETQIYRRSERESKTHSQSVGKQNWSLCGLQESTWGNHKELDRLKSFIQAAHLFETSQLIDTALPTKFAFSPRAASPILEAIADFFVATKVDSQRSPLAKDQINQGWASKIVSLIDDGLDTRAPHYSPFDLDGIATQRTALIERGQIKSFLYDSQSSVRANCRSTGNSLRDPKELEPRVKPRRVVLCPADLDSPGFWSSNEDGLCIEGWSKIEIKENLELTGCVFGWLVECGKKTKPIKIDSFKVSLPEFLRGVVGLGSQIESFGLCNCPTVFLRRENETQNLCSY